MSDHRTLQMGPWVEGRLLLFDLSCFRYQLFDSMDRIGGNFINRLATNADPCIVTTHRQWRGRAIELEGTRLKEVSGRLKRDVLDAEVEVAFKRLVYAGTRRTARRRLCLVAVRLPESTEYRFYLTNIDPDSLDAHAVAQPYAARWQIEFKRPLPKAFGHRLDKTARRQQRQAPSPQENSLGRLLRPAIRLRVFRSGLMPLDVALVVMNSVGIGPVLVATRFGFGILSVDVIKSNFIISVKCTKNICG